MQFGKVTYWSDKGFGFITPDKGGDDVFAHISKVEGDDLDSLPEGVRVRYEIAEGRRPGTTQAVNIFAEGLS